MAWRSRRRSAAALHNSASPTITGTMWVSVGRTGSLAAWSARFVAAACRWCASRSADECLGEGTLDHGHAVHHAITSSEPAPGSAVELDRVNLIEVVHRAILVRK